MAPTLHACFIDKTKPEPVQRVAAIWDAVYGRELHWLDPGGTRLVQDEYHDASEYLLTWIEEAGMICDVGTARVVLDSPAGLPIDKFADLAPFRTKGMVAEVQRMMVTEESRRRPLDGAPFGLMAYMLRALMRAALARGVRIVAVNAFDDPRSSPVHAFRALGFETVGMPFHDHELHSDVPSIAMVIDLPHALERGRSTRQNRFIAYMLEADGFATTINLPVQQGARL